MSHSLFQGDVPDGTAPPPCIDGDMPGDPVTLAAALELGVAEVLPGSLEAYTKVLLPATEDARAGLQ